MRAVNSTQGIVSQVHKGIYSSIVQCGGNYLFLYRHITGGGYWWLVLVVGGWGLQLALHPGHQIRCLDGLL